MIFYFVFLTQMSDMLKLVVLTAACTAHILLIANSLSLPMSETADMLRGSPWLTFLFLLACASSVTQLFLPAFLGTCLYVFIEKDNLITHFENFWSKEFINSNR